MKFKMKKDEKDEVLDELSREVKESQNHCNLILALGSKAMMTRHWNKVYTVLEAPVTNSSIQTITLNTLTEEYHAMEHLEEIEDISGAAQGELQIQNTLNGVIQRWEEINFVVISYRDSKERFVITEVEDLITLLEDDTMTVSTMMGSKFVLEIKEQVESWEKRLGYLADVIDEWLKF
jgi:dynein heavy chain, axonemal